MIILATFNDHKARELSQMLGLPPTFVTSCAALGLKEKVSWEENGLTFEENALIKARAVAAFFPQEIILADDSGLEVAALNGAPGIYSARYAGPDASDLRNNEKLLTELTNTTDRQAQFRCCLVLLEPRAKVPKVFNGVCQGEILQAPRGQHGFGYDPLFWLSELGSSMAELTAEKKNQISHRAKACFALKEHLAREHAEWF